MSTKDRKKKEMSETKRIFNELKILEDFK